MMVGPQPGAYGPARLRRRSPETDATLPCSVPYAADSVDTSKVEGWGDKLRGVAVKALTWHGKREARIGSISDPAIKDPTRPRHQSHDDRTVRSDLRLYEPLGPFLDVGAVLGHEPMGVVHEVGTAVTAVRPGDRVVGPFNVSCGRQPKPRTHRSGSSPRGARPRDCTGTRGFDVRLWTWRGRRPFRWRGWPVSGVGGECCPAGVVAKDCGDGDSDGEVLGGVE